MYFPFFVAYMAVGFIICLAAFLWALNRGQFGEQQRARFLPLEDRPAEGPVRLTKAGRWHARILLGMAGSGLLATGVAIVVSLVVSGGR
jgi:nitrogen fixation-related uncharacterized protein